MYSIYINTRTWLRALIPECQHRLAKKTFPVDLRSKSFLPSDGYSARSSKARVPPKSPQMGWEMCWFPLWKKETKMKKKAVFTHPQNVFCFQDLLNLLALRLSSLLFFISSPFPSRKTTRETPAALADEKTKEKHLRAATRSFAT